MINDAKLDLCGVRFNMQMMLTTMYVAMINPKTNKNLLEFSIAKGPNNEINKKALIDGICDCLQTYYPDLIIENSDTENLIG